MVVMDNGHHLPNVQNHAVKDLRQEQENVLKQDGIVRVQQVK